MTLEVFDGHSVLSPSGADNWGNCVGALAACKSLPKRRDSEPAAKGTAKHKMSEYILTGPYPTRGATFAVGSTVKADGFEFVVDDEFADHVEMYVNYANSRTGRKFFESRISTSHIFGVPNQGGTIDCKVLNDAERQIEIIDAKFGYIPIGAKHRQLRIYGSATLDLHDMEGEWDTVRCTIVQPQDLIEPIKSHVYTRAEIEAFIVEFAPIAKKAWELYENPPADLLKYLTPSDEACAWCPLAEVGCVARNNHIVNMFDDVSAKTPDIVLMTDAQLGELYPKVADIAEWAKQITAEAEARAQLGATIPEHKLVWGRKGKRKYVEGSEPVVRGVLEMALGADDMYEPRKMLSPTKVEDALKKAKAPALYAQIAPFVTQSDPKLRLVPLTAAGDAVTVTKVEFGVVS